MIPRCIHRVEGLCPDCAAFQSNLVRATADPFGGHWRPGILAKIAHDPTRKADAARPTAPNLKP